MIDLIIPVYKNREGLLITLNSINYNVFNVVVIEDGSKEIHKLKYPIKVFRQKNTGPGMARQHGLNITTNPYVMFIDAGDYFISKEVQEQIAKTIEQDPVTDVFQWQYYRDSTLSAQSDNRMHGKIYKRVFLTYHNITFSKSGSYLDEDIGFNRACRLILLNCGKCFRYVNVPVIKWVKSDSSITQKDNNASLYRDQTKGLAINSIHYINNCIGKVKDQYIYDEINEIASALYYWFVQTAANRPEYLNEAWRGAKIFYDKYNNKINVDSGSLGSKNFIRSIRIGFRFNALPFRINYGRFIQDMRQYKNVPPWYCGQ